MPNLTNNCAFFIPSCPFPVPDCQPISSSEFHTELMNFKSLIPQKSVSLFSKTHFIRKFIASLSSTPSQDLVIDLLADTGFLFPSGYRYHVLKTYHTNLDFKHLNLRSWSRDHNHKKYKILLSSLSEHEKRLRQIAEEIHDVPYTTGDRLFFETYLKRKIQLKTLFAFVSNRHPFAVENGNEKSLKSRDLDSKLEDFVEKIHSIPFNGPMHPHTQIYLSVFLKYMSVASPNDNISPRISALLYAFDKLEADSILKPIFLWAFLLENTRYIVGKTSCAKETCMPPDSSKLSNKEVTLFFDLYMISGCPPASLTPFFTFYPTFWGKSSAKKSQLYRTFDFGKSYFDSIPNKLEKKITSFSKDCLKIDYWKFTCSLPHSGLLLQKQAKALKPYYAQTMEQIAKNTVALNTYRQLWERKNSTPAEMIDFLESLRKKYNTFFESINPQLAELCSSPVDIIYNPRSKKHRLEQLHYNLLDAAFQKILLDEATATLQNAALSIMQNFKT